MTDTPVPETRALLRLLQLSDSAFPTGAYAFSDGLETLVVRGEVKSANDLHAFLHGQLAQGWGGCDPGACALAWAGASSTELDDLLDLLKPVSGPRMASLRIGHNLHRAAVKLWPELLEGLAPHRHHAAVFGAVARRLGARQTATVTAYVSSFLLGRATSATRLMRLGGLDVQRVVSRLEAEAAACVERAMSATPDDLGGFAPGLEVAAAEQPGLDVRLFQS